MVSSFLILGLVILVLILLSGFFSGSETALTATSRARMYQLAKENDKRAKWVNSLLEQHERLLSAILLGNNLVNIMASALAGIGFGNAGVHLPHGMSYPVAGMVKTFIPSGYAVDYPLVPHGIAVIVNAPSVFRFTGPANPQRHLHAAEVLGADVSEAHMEEAGEVLAMKIIELMRQLDMPNGLSALGYRDDHIPALVQGTLPQHRVTKLSPRPAEEEELSMLFAGAMRYW